MTKTGDFEQDVKSGYYRWEKQQRLEHRIRRRSGVCPVDTFGTDFEQFLSARGIPPRYVKATAGVIKMHAVNLEESIILSMAHDFIALHTYTPQSQNI